MLEKFIPDGTYAGYELSSAGATAITLRTHPASYKEPDISFYETPVAEPPASLSSGELEEWHHLQLTPTLCIKAAYSQTKRAVAKAAARLILLTDCCIQLVITVNIDGGEVVNKQWAPIRSVWWYFWEPVSAVFVG